MRTIGSTRSLIATATAVASSAAVAILFAAAAHANHPVLVEGNCNVPPAGSSGPVTAGTCGDYDGDGKIGTAEDSDGDRVFGTLNGALGPGTSGNGANQNGLVTIVTSGTFAEQVTITGNVTLQAAPGVEAVVDAVLQGDPGNTARQAQPGVVVNAPANRRVIIRNILSRNWTSGFKILGDSHVALDRVRAENNVNYGVEIRNKARVAITRSEVHATGFRLNPATGDFPTTGTPSPGRGIEFEDSSSGTVFDSAVTGSFDAGIANESSSKKSVCVSHVNAFDTDPDFSRVTIARDGVCDEVKTASARRALRR